MMPSYESHGSNYAMIWRIALLILVITLVGCNLPVGQDGDTDLPPEPTPVPQMDQPQPPPPDAPEYLPLITNDPEARLSLSISVTEENTQGRILQVVVHNEAISETVLYWTDPGSDQIQRAVVGEWGVQDLIEDGLGEPRGIVLDIQRSKMLWTDVTYDHIQRANLDGTEVENLVEDGMLAPFGITLSEENEQIFWSDVETRSLTRAGINGTSPSPAVAEASPATFGTVVDDVRSLLFWIEEGRIRRSNLDGTNIQGVLATDNPAFAITVDIEAGKIYWTESGRILRANNDGSEKELLIDDFEGPSYGIVLDVTEGLMYWTEFDSGKIRRAGFDGSQVEDVITGLETPSGIALHKWGDAFVRLPCGLTLEPGGGREDLQRLMVIQKDGILVPAGSSIDFSPYVICIEAGQGTPELEVEYSVGTIADGDLLQLAECICERELISEEDSIAYIGQQFGLQFAVWQVAGGLAVDELNEQLAEGGGAMDTFGEIAEIYNSIGAMLPDFVDWLETCGIEIEP